MPDIYLPTVMKNAGGAPGGTGGNQRLVIDPLTRIEGHLRIEAVIENGVVKEAYSSSTMFRGIEPVLLNRDPREAWVFAQRICGVCTHVHAIASIRAVENALGIPIPDNARLVRNLLTAAQFVQDHVIHFYHLHALDWVDIVAALDADPAATSDLAKSISAWPNNSADYFKTVQDRVRAFANSGQLGIFANGYWGHPAYALPAEGNLLAVAHYLEALDWQQDFIKIHAILGGKNPHMQTYLVGGMAVPVDPNSVRAINPTRIAQMRTLLEQAVAFVDQVYLPDLKLVASFYKEWAGYGAGPGNFLSYGEFDSDTSASPDQYWLPRGVVVNRNLSRHPDTLDPERVKESVAHSWYDYSGGDGTPLHPSTGETTPHYTGPQPPFQYLKTGEKYSWLKSPRYNDQPMEVGPLARMLVGYAAGVLEIKTAVNGLLADLGVGAEALFSTLGRVAARGIETQLIAHKMGEWIDALEDNMNAGGSRLAIHNGDRWDPATWPAEATGWGTTEAPRGALGHWIKIAGGKITHYQAVVPTTWNGSPRDGLGQPGTWEQALVGTPVADPARPVEILRTVHSFDPCMACSVHLVDATGKTVNHIQVSIA